MIVIGVLTAVTYVLGKSALQQMYAEAQMPTLPDWVFIVLPGYGHLQCRLRHRLI